MCIVTALRTSSNQRTVVDGSISIAHDFEIRKNLLYVDWNDTTKKWSRALEKKHRVTRVVRDAGYKYDPRYGAYVKVKRINDTCMAEACSYNPDLE